MVPADGTSEAQTEKVDRQVHKRLEQIRLSVCPPGMANYMVTTIAGGLLNYHAPFTRISKSMRDRWERHQACGHGLSSYGLSSHGLSSYGLHKNENASVNCNFRHNFERPCSYDSSYSDSVALKLRQ